MTRDELIPWLRRTKLATAATTHADGHPQAAVIGLAVTDSLELVFDTLATSRKAENLRRDPRIALVFWDAALTVQIEGLADLPTGDTLERLRVRYLDAFPDGQERAAQPDIVYWRVVPTWIRASDYATVPPTIVTIHEGAR